MSMIFVWRREHNRTQKVKFIRYYFLKYVVKFLIYKIEIVGTCVYVRS
jgi:hypothetical protein